MPKGGKKYPTRKTPTTPKKPTRSTSAPKTRKPKY